MKKITLAIFIATTLFATTLFAADSNVTPAQKKNVDVALEKISKVAGKKLTADSVNATPIPGLLQVTSDLSIFYVTDNGKYVISGDVLDLSKDPKSWSLTEQAMRKVRKETLSKLDPKDMIIFPATATKVGAVTIFTDVDCHYCQKLQENIKDYTDKGIEIRYLAFPRQGPGSKSAKKAISIWCSTERNKAFSEAAAGKEIPDNQCKENPVDSDFDLGRRLGVTGTPTIIFENGMKVGGLMTADEMLKMIKSF